MSLSCDFVDRNNVYHPQLFLTNTSWLVGKSYKKRTSVDFHLICEKHNNPTSSA